MTTTDAAFITIIVLFVLLAIVTAYGVYASRKLQKEVDAAKTQENKALCEYHNILKRVPESKRLDTMSCFFIREPHNPHQPAVPFEKLAKAIAENAYKKVYRVIEDAPPGFGVKICIHWAAEAVASPLPEVLACDDRTRFNG